MKGTFKKILDAMTPWYDEKEATEREERSEVVIVRARRVHSDAIATIEAYHRADELIRNRNVIRP